MLSDTQIKTSSYLIKQLPKATVFMDKKLSIIYTSDSFVDGYVSVKKDIIGTYFPDLFPRLSKKFKDNLNKTIKGKKNKTITERYLDDFDNECWIECENIPWFDQQENVIGVIVQVENITEKVQKTLQQEKLEILFKEKSEIGKIGSWEYDAVKDQLFWCDMTKKIHEVPEDFQPNIETGIDFYKPGYSRNTIALLVDNAMRNGKPWNQKLQIVTAKGNEKWVKAAGRPLFKNNKFIGLIGTFQDIHQNVIAELKTKGNENLLRTLIDNLPLNVFIKDLDSRKILVNKAECEYLGVDRPEQILGKNDFDLYPKKIAQISREEDLSVINSLQPVLGKETESIKKDGTRTTFLTSKIPLIGDDGLATGLVGISLDISNIKEKENELRNLINVTSLQNKKLINFAHIVSHNLRSHTANFSMLLDFLVTEKCEKEKENIVKMLTDASDNLLETLDNLNEVVAISTNINLEKKSVCLSGKIKKVEENLMAFLINNNAKIINKIPNETYVNVIPAYIESILMNFITNAVKYKSPERDPVVKLSVSTNDSYTILSIEDNGLGIDLKKYGDKLFGMYKTFHNNSDARGIGLYITKNQIEAMNGKVIVCSEVGKGSTFNIYFNDKD